VPPKKKKERKKERKQNKGKGVKKVGVDKMPLLISIVKYQILYFMYSLKKENGPKDTFQHTNDKFPKLLKYINLQIQVSQQNSYSFNIKSTRR
jgi:hypothetical protein